MMIMNAALYCKAKVDSVFRRVFKEQSGGAELIASLVIVGIVLVLAFTFKDKLSTLVGNLWDEIVMKGNEDVSRGAITSEWG